MKTRQKIKELSQLDFTGKGESFVEAKFLTPLLECLGYETHDDYEVKRHGDDGASFKLKYPPVEGGAVKTKHYSPDYVPTIRKKTFWVIEAKAPKSVKHPFNYNYIVQGLQYCIHPEIQAKYLVLSNGLHTSIYDPQEAIFFDGDIYEPIFEFEHKELPQKWEDIFTLLGTEKIREKIEAYLQAHYEKLCLSSLDANYPADLAQRISSNKLNLKQQISKHVVKLYVENMDANSKEMQEVYQKSSITQLETCMKYPIGSGKQPSQYYVDKLLHTYEPAQLFEKLISNFSTLSYFQKEHCFISICYLHQLIKDQKLKAEITKFVKKEIANPISLLNKAESAVIRIIRKMIMIDVYPILRQEISERLKSLPEIERFVQKPLAQNQAMPYELQNHDQYFKILLNMNENSLSKVTSIALAFEESIEEDFQKAKKAIPQGEREINGLEWYGSGDKIYTLKNIALNSNVITKEEHSHL